MISRFSFTDQLSVKERSNKNLLLLIEQVKADTSKDWGEISKVLVENHCLLEPDAIKLGQYWKELYYEQEADKIIALKPSKLEHLCTHIWDSVMHNKIVADYFQRLILGGIYFGFTYFFLHYTMDNEIAPYCFAIATSVWSTMTFGYKHKESELFGAAMTCFILLFLGYWGLKLLALIFG